MIGWLIVLLTAACAAGVWWLAYLVNEHLHGLRTEHGEDLRRISNAVAAVNERLAAYEAEKRKEKYAKDATF
jgi:hypothetical protein